MSTSEKDKTEFLALHNLMDRQCHTLERIIEDMLRECDPIYRTPAYSVVFGEIIKELSDCLQDMLKERERMRATTINSENNSVAGKHDEGPTKQDS